MNGSLLRWRLGLCLVLQINVSLFGEALITQSFVLRTGWNAIYVEVNPTNAAVDAVFSGLPLDSAWSLQNRLSTAEFVRDQNEATWNRAGWGVYFPPGRDEAINNNFFAVTPHQPYLLKITNNATLTITGEPVFRKRRFEPQAFNLRGFPVDEPAAPKFIDYFKPSRAQFDADANRLQPIYRLNNASSRWELVDPNSTMRRGEAYWVFASEDSDYIAPINVRFSTDAGLDFGDTLQEATVTLRNEGASPSRVEFSMAAVQPVSIRTNDAANPARLWAPAPQTLAVDVLPGVSGEIRLRPRRVDLNANSQETVVTIKDGQGAAHQVALSIRRAPASGAGRFAGLWMGQVTLNAVSQANSNVPEHRTTPATTAAPLTFRLLLHTSTNGATRLLKEVVQMFQNGTTTNDARGRAVTATPGRYVFLTSEEKIPLYAGAAMRDGEPVGRRLSSALFDFLPTQGTNSLALAGQLAPSGSLTGAIAIGADHPTNPFKHKYHPDHDNLDAPFQSFRAEAYAITREITLNFDSADPRGTGDPEYGSSRLSGAYREKVTGLHAQPIFTSGPFTITRVTANASLIE